MRFIPERLSFYSAARQCQQDTYPSAVYGQAEVAGTLYLSPRIEASASEIELSEDERSALIALLTRIAERVESEAIPTPST